MGSMLRSDDMTACDIYLQPEVAFEIISRLGELGCVQFKDMTPSLNAYQRKYTTEIRRCTELDRKLRYLRHEMRKYEIYMPPMSMEPEAMRPHSFNSFETMLEKWETDILEMERNQHKLMKNYLELSEMYYVLTHIDSILGDVELRRDSIFKQTYAIDIGLTGRLIIKTGVVRRSKIFFFETMLWRVTRGNIFFRTATLDKKFEDPATGTMVRKVAFVVVCQGDELNSRLEKICAGFRVNIYHCPKTIQERMDMMEKLRARCDDLEQVLKKTKYLRCKTLRIVGKQWPTWDVQVKKARAVYHMMNLFTKDITSKCLIGQCWIPDVDLPAVQSTLEKHSIGVNVPSFILPSITKETPPTYHRTNKFTYGFQALIGAYGDSSYRELNPGLYTIITFPFLFAVMFGDSGHGIIILSFAIWMLKNEQTFLAERSTNEIWNIFFGDLIITNIMVCPTISWEALEALTRVKGASVDHVHSRRLLFHTSSRRFEWLGRYIILLMGIFSIYTGFLYNDWFSKALSTFDSYWVNQFTIEELAANAFVTLDPKKKTNISPYPLGVDPVWKLAENKIMFDNSLKMKMSIILGVIHMLFGLVLSLLNHIHFGRTYAIILEFIPQALFLCCLFMWLVFLIYYKWVTYGAKDKTINLEPGCAPLILILFIDMCLMRTTKTEELACEPYMFNNQQTIQKALLFISLLCVPVMLFGSPIYKYKKAKREQMEELKKGKKTGGGGGGEEQPEGEEHEEESHSFSELMIHQAVHTIEYVLSTISHTASYLRLWALSLAHAELSEMLWDMILSKIGLRTNSYWGSFKLYVIFTIWSAFSISILVVMEGLSAFLHTLRLHWVEFMSKFYVGGGIIFHPFNFEEVVLVDKDDKQDPMATK